MLVPFEQRIVSNTFFWASSFQSPAWSLFPIWIVLCTRKRGYPVPHTSHSLLHLTELILWSASAPSAGKWSCLVILCEEYISGLTSEPKNYLRRLASFEADSCTFNSEIFSCYEKSFPQFSLCCLDCSLHYLIFFNHDFHFMWCIIVTILFHSMFMLEFSVSMGADLFLCSFLCSPFKAKMIFKKMWERRKLSFNIVLLIFSACLNIPEIIKIIYFFILLFHLWHNDLLFPLWKKSLNFLSFLTILHLKWLFSSFIFSLCASPKIFLSVQVVNVLDCLSTSAAWGCAIFASW